MQILKFVDICGGYNLGLSKLSKYQNMINLVHISLVLFLMWYLSRLMEFYYSKMLLLEAISECIQYLIALCTYGLIIIDSIFYHREHYDFWTTVQQIDRCYHSQTNINFDSFKVKLGIYLLKSIFIFLLRLYIQPYASFQIDFSYLYLFTMCEVRMFYYIFCLEILHFQLNVIDKELHEIIEGCQESKKSSKFPFKWFRGYFHNIHQIIYRLNQIFSWSHVSGISFCFFYLLTEIHWYYIHYSNMAVAYKIG